MPTRDIHSEPFDEATQLKLAMFRDYARIWVPAFVHKKRDLIVIDAFAGPGSDVNGVPGSPHLFLDAIVEQRGRLLANGSSVTMILNELNRSKVAALRTSMEARVDGDVDLKRLVRLDIRNEDAIGLLKSVLANPTDQPALVCIDQNGIKALSRDVIELLSQWSKLDLLMFCPSSFIGRFGEGPEYKTYIGYLDTEKIGDKPVHLQHRELTRQLREHFSEDHHLKFAPFSIKKDSGNTYGVVFGSHHYLGLEKFLGVAWHLNPINGEANFDIDGDVDIERQRDLFGERLTKKQLFQDELTKRVLAGNLRSNLEVYPFTLESGFLPSLASETLSKLRKQGSIRFEGRPLVSWNMFREKRQLVYEVTHESK